MAGTEAADWVGHPLGEAHLDGLLALSRAAGWNQVEDDWRHLLSAGRGHGLSSADGTVVASCVVLPYAAAGAPGAAQAGAGAAARAAPAPGFAWISMVLVHPDHRGAGLATRVLRRALDACPHRPVLDATPAGLPVYRRLGFDGAWSFARYQGGGARRSGAPAEAPPTPTPPTPPPGVRIEPLHGPLPGALADLDRAAFGGDRTALLRHLAGRAPGLAHVALHGDRPVGFVLGRPGRQATQVGPLVAEDAGTGVALLDAALSTLEGPVFVDVPDREDRMLSALRARGFVPQRPFTRLTLDPPGAPPSPPPGTAPTVRLVAGPELG